MMAEISPGISSPNLKKDFGFAFHFKSRVVNSYLFSEEIVERVYALGGKDKNFYTNAKSIMDLATTALDQELSEPGYEPQCRAHTAEQCRACIGSSMYLGVRDYEKDADGSLPFEIAINIDCDRAMVRRQEKSDLEPAPIELRTIKRKKKSKAEKLYEGKRIFDNGCYHQMGGMVVRLAELFEAELSVMEAAVLKNKENNK